MPVNHSPVRGNPGDEPPQQSGQGRNVYPPEEGLPPRVEINIGALETELQIPLQQDNTTATRIGEPQSDEASGIQGLPAADLTFEQPPRRPMEENVLERVTEVCKPSTHPIPQDEFEERFQQIVREQSARLEELDAFRSTSTSFSSARSNEAPLPPMQSTAHLTPASTYAPSIMQPCHGAIPRTTAYARGDVVSEVYQPRPRTSVGSSPAYTRPQWHHAPMTAPHIHNAAPEPPVFHAAPGYSTLGSGQVVEANQHHPAMRLPCAYNVPIYGTTRGEPTYMVEDKYNPNKQYDYSPNTYLQSFHRNLANDLPVHVDPAVSRHNLKKDVRFVDNGKNVNFLTPVSYGMEQLFTDKPKQMFLDNVSERQEAKSTTPYETGFNSNSFINTAHNKFSNITQVSKLLKLVPRFDGSNMNPVMFLNTLLRVLTGHDADLNSFLRVGFAVFEGDARTWALYALDSCNSFDAFSEAFLSEFWGHARQRELRWSVDHGTYAQSAGNFATYFHRLATQAQYLTPAYDEPYLVRSLAAHYPSFVASRLAGVHTVRAATLLLRELDEIHSRPRQPNQNTPNQPRESHQNSRPGAYRGNHSNSGLVNNGREGGRPRVSRLEEVESGVQETPASENY